MTETNNIEKTEGKGTRLGPLKNFIAVTGASIAVGPPLNDAAMAFFTTLVMMKNQHYYGEPLYLITGISAIVAFIGSLCVNGRSIWDSSNRINEIIEQIEQAKDIVDNALSAQAPTGFKWKCSECDEEVEPQFSECWKCGKSRKE